MAANHKGYIFSDPNSEIVLLMIQKTLWIFNLPSPLPKGPSINDISSEGEGEGPPQSRFTT